VPPLARVVHLAHLQNRREHVERMQASMAGRTGLHRDRSHQAGSSLVPGGPVRGTVHAQVRVRPLPSLASCPEVIVFLTANDAAAQSARAPSSRPWQLQNPGRARSTRRDDSPATEPGAPGVLAAVRHGGAPWRRAFPSWLTRCGSSGRQRGERAGAGQVIENDYLDVFVGSASCSVACAYGGTVHGPGGGSGRGASARGARVRSLPSNRTPPAAAAASRAITTE
jgi:hypothetical protein